MRICGTIYSIGAVILTKFIEDMPVFGWIVDNVLHESMKPLLVIDVLQTTCFNKHFYTYMCELKEKIIRAFYVCPQSDLADYHTLSIYTPQNSHQFMIPMKYYILTDLILMFKHTMI